MPRLMIRRIILWRAFAHGWTAKRPDFNALRPFHAVLTSAHARFYFSFAIDMCLFTFRPTHPASIVWLSWHMWINRSRILPITSVVFACSTMPYLIFQCWIISANRLSTSPRLRSSCSSTRRTSTRIRLLFILQYWHHWRQQAPLNDHLSIFCNNFIYFIILKIL